MTNIEEEREHYRRVNILNREYEEKHRQLEKEFREKLKILRDNYEMKLKSENERRAEEKEGKQ